MPISDEDFQNEICGIVTKYGVRDIYDATTEILLAVEKKQQPRQEWIPDIQALAQLWTRNYQKATHLPTDTDTLDEVIQEGLEKLFGETRQQPLPEPPKEK